MPLMIQCSSCGQKLRVPDDQIGRKVRCPACKVVFTAAADAAPEAQLETVKPEPPCEERISKAEAARPPSPPRAGMEEEERPRRGREHDEEYEEDRPRRRREEDEDEDDRPRGRREREDDERSPRRREREEDDDDYRPRRRRRRRRSHADPVALVYGPATALRICGKVGIGVGIAAILLNIIMTSAVAPATRRRPVSLVREFPDRLPS